MLGRIEKAQAPMQLLKVYAEDFAYARADLCRYPRRRREPMKSNHPKVLASVLFTPMLQWVMDAAEGAGCKAVRGDGT